MNKETIRQYVIESKQSIGFPILQANSTIAIRRLKALPAYGKSASLAAFAPKPDEIDVALLMSQKERTIFMPAFDETRKVYRFAKLGSTFKKNKFDGIEPVDPVFADPDEIDLILIPGVAFSEDGQRIGPELDYYNELIEQYPNATKVAMVHELQLFKTVPADADDLRVDYVITEASSLEITEK